MHENQQEHAECRMKLTVPLQVLLAVASGRAAGEIDKERDTRG
jgi:hypothetical protein